MFTNDWTEAKLQQFITDEVEESLRLEYKSAPALGNSDQHKSEISKDVSAMANSAGGVIIYGLKEFGEKEKRHLPERIDPINRLDFSKERLEQIINSIQPRINGILIYSVDLSSDPNHVAYAVDIPQSTTAHQAKDKRYYKRFNFLSQAMDDYEIRDIMARISTPKIKVEFTIQPEKHSHDRNTWYDYIDVWGVNEGNIIARNVSVLVDIIDGLMGRTNHLRLEPLIIKNGVYYRQFRGQNINQGGIAGFQCLTPPFSDESLKMLNGPIYFDPILPGMRVRLCSIEVKELRFWKDIANNHSIDWQSFADNAPRREGSAMLTDVMVNKSHGKWSAM